MISNKLVCMLRVKDGILFAKDWLERTEKLVDEIVVVDNGSTDGTLEILKNSPKVVHIEHTQGFDEGRDKILIYEKALERNPDWILWIDIDEIFEDLLTREKLEKMMLSKKITRYWFRRFHLHKDDKHFEAGFRKIREVSWPDRVLWKNQPTGYFEYKKIHCNLIKGITGKSSITKYRIKHYGSINKEYLHRKTDLYISVDPEQRAKYVHNRDQELKTLRWYEYKENPFIVSTQVLLFNIIFSLDFVKTKILKIRSI